MLIVVVRVALAVLALHQLSAARLLTQAVAAAADTMLLVLAVLAVAVMVAQMLALRERVVPEAAVAAVDLVILVMAAPVDRVL